ncbi:MAG: hypothetical protein Q8Q89_02410 [bacterium]|nr:hypothetical protein [bacterium]
MFILIPLSFIFVSLIGIFFIVYRKKSYLEKLHSLNTAGDSEAASVTLQRFNLIDFGTDLFPEVNKLLSKIDINKHKTVWLVETEKFVRKVRLVFLRVDRLSDSLIKKIRRVHTNGKLNGHATDQQSEILTSSPVSDLVQTVKISPNFLKNEEERLIIEIAQNPKDSNLYEKLGDLYIEMENWLDAKESYEAAIELNSTDEELKKKLSSALEKLASH